MISCQFKYSVIILLEEIYDDFSVYIESLNSCFEKKGESYEILIIANGIGHLLRKHANFLSTVNTDIKTIEFPTVTSRAVCLRAGLEEILGEIIVVCGSYQQITNESLVNLLDSLDNEVDIVTPWRQKRVDSSLHRFHSRAFNAIVRWFLKTNLHDLSCTLRVFRREVLEETRLYGSMYRFLPIIAEQRGFKTKEVKCEHLHERGSAGFYRFSDYMSRFIDIFTLYFNTKFTRKPLRFFSSIGVIFLFIGIATLGDFFVERFFFNVAIGNRSFLILGLISIIIGTQVASVGLLGEIIAFTNGRKYKEYTIEKILN